jgi:putative ABC transport system permease protein
MGTAPGMRPADYFSMAFDYVTHRKLRAFLTMLGIFIGVASVVALISLGQGLSESVNYQFRKIGTDKLLVMPGSGAGPGAALASKLLSERDLSAVKNVRGVERAGYIIQKSARVVHDSRAVFAMVIGIPTSSDESGVIEELRSIQPVEGRGFAPSDAKKALVGYNVAKGGHFPHDLKLGDFLLVNGTQFRVIGLLKKVGDPFVDNGVIIPAGEAKELFSTPYYNAIAVRAESGIPPASLREPLEKALRQSRGVQKGKEDFRVQTTDQLLSSFNTIFGIVQAFVIGIAAISLVVGAIGIMNTMYTAVLERTKEIGVMKAVGAKNSEIMAVFLVEAGMLGLVGGLVGILLGFLTAKVAEIIANQALGLELVSVYFSPQLVAGALAFSFIVGSLSGAYPALQAARLQPVDALRYE